MYLNAITRANRNGDPKYELLPCSRPKALDQLITDIGAGHTV